MKKENSQTPKPKIVKLGPESLSDGEPLETDEQGSKRAESITQSTIIRASAERCFQLIAKQLEETPHWDPTIICVNPISLKHVRVGSMSQVTFSIDGIREDAITMIRSFRPNRSILWTSNHSGELQEEWQLQPEPHGTLVTVTLGYNPSIWVFELLSEKTVNRSEVEKAISEMLEMFKTTAEGRQQV
jgi:ribosome-associated toxin RatA of RatAB toxin-antitoxin module